MGDETDSRKRPLLFLCLLMVGVGVALAFDHTSGFFGQWRARGIETFSLGFAHPEMDPALSTFEGILGGSMVGRWGAAWGLARFGPLGRERWVAYALMWGLPITSLFEFGILQVYGLPLEAVLPELGLALVSAVLIWRLRGPAGATRATTLAKSDARGAQIFAWGNIALGLVLGVVVQAEIFSIYRDGMSKAWFEGGPLPQELLDWLGYAYGSIGAGFAGHFLLLVWVARHAGRSRWGLTLYGGSVAAWFAVDSAACLLQGAAFNVILVNVPAFVAAVLVLLPAWRRR